MAVAVVIWDMIGDIRGGAPVFRWARISPCVVYIILCEAKSTIPDAQHDSGSQKKNYLASARLAPIATLASTSFANPAFSYLAVVLVSALRGVQSPEGEKT
jgi:hypothetical protein